jgi:hypothetical protein
VNRPRITPDPGPTTAVAPAWLGDTMYVLVLPGIRAREAGRVIVAVFYDEPGIRSRPTAYSIWSIDIKTMNAQELVGDEGYGYRIRGRK